MSDKKKQAYSLAQQLEERVDVLSRQKGWTEVFIPEIERKREETQRRLNTFGYDLQQTSYDRGLLNAYDHVLQFVEKKLEAAKMNMAKNLDGAV